MTPSRMMTRQPIWYWAPWDIHGVRYHGYDPGYHPNGPHGPGGWGLHVNTLPKRAVAGVCLILFLIFNYVVILTARAAVARGLPGPAEDPLRQAKEVLGRPARCLRTCAPDCPRP